MALTINFMPAYAQAPAALAALKADVDAAVRKAAAEGARVVLPADEPELCDAFEAAGVAVARADASFGYVYGNDTAVARLFAGEKPIPSAVTGSASDTLVGGEAWLRGEGAPKLVYVNGATEPVELPAQVSVAELAKAAGVEDAKAVYLGFPQGDMVAASGEGDVLLASDVVRVFGADCCMADELVEDLPRVPPRDVRALRVWPRGLVPDGHDPGGRLPQARQVW
jgi:NADH-quinone oxidoreductase subunit F